MRGGLSKTLLCHNPHSPPALSPSTYSSLALTAVRMHSCEFYLRARRFLPVSHFSRNHMSMNGIKQGLDDKERGIFSELIIVDKHVKQYCNVSLHSS